MRKRVSVLLVLMLVFLALVPSGFAGGEETAPRVERNKDVLDIGPWLRFRENDEDISKQIDEQIRQAAAKIDFDEATQGEEDGAESAFTYDGGTKWFLALDTIYGYYVKTYTLRSVGEDVEIWVADDISYLPDDPRDDPVITQGQVDLLRDEFDSNIYPTDTNFFGMPDAHDGSLAVLDDILGLPEDYYMSEEGQRNIILVDNIGDESYHDPDYPLFIAGFYSSEFESYMDRNIISLDTNSWETRLESTFFGTTAHEYQHLIHDDNDPYETTWLNEGMSDFAEYLCGYGHPESHVGDFLQYPENSLVDWDEHGNLDPPETLADYGQAYLLQLYLHDQFGADFTREVAMSPISGFESINAVLDNFGAGIDFEEVFRRFCVAVAIDAPMPERGIYEFTSIDLFADPFTGLSYQSALEFDKDGVPAWGGDYKRLTNMKNIKGVIFDGIDFMPTPWLEVDESPDGGGAALYGNMGDEKDNMMILPVDLTGVTTASVQFDTWFDIEEQWDFGMVQVSTDGGFTWVSLANEHTRDDIVDDGYPAIEDNLPGLTHWSGTSTEGATWMSMEFDLDAYTGQEIHIAFRYMTDWGYNELGWFVKNIEIPGVYLGIENGSLDGFYSLQEITETYVDYQVVFINRTGNRVNHVINLDPMNVTEMDAIKLKQLLSAGETDMIVWYPAPEGTKGYVDFTYQFLTPQEMKGIPALPYGPEEPFGPENPAGPGDPDDPGVPDDPIGPDDPVDPGKPNKPGKPVHPVHPIHPIKPEK